MVETQGAACRGHRQGVEEAGLAGKREAPPDEEGAGGSGARKQFTVKDL